MQSNHEMLQELFDQYLVEGEKFGNGNKAAGTRARKALTSITKVAKDIRKEIQDTKNAA